MVTTFSEGLKSVFYLCLMNFRWYKKVKKQKHAGPSKLFLFHQAHQALISLFSTNILEGTFCKKCKLEYLTGF